MSVSLTTQIRDYYSYVDEQQGPVDITAVREREQLARPVQITTPHPSELVRTLRTGKPTVQRHRLAVALVAVVSVLVLLGAVNWLLRSGVEDSPVVTQPPTPTLSSLSRVPHDEEVFGGEYAQTMWSVTVGGPGLVAVGWDELRGAVVWTSDGVSWSRVPHDEAIFGGGQMLSVTVGGPGLVAVGTDGSFYRESSYLPGEEDYLVEGDAAVWTSVDGITWSRVPHDEAVFGGGSMSSVTVGGPGLVAIGLERRRDEFGDLVDRAAVWTSVDGITWSRVPHDEAVFGGGSMSSVTVGGPGLVAVGGADSGAAVWTSIDGITWSRVPHDEAVFGGEDPYHGSSMSSVTVGGPGLVAVGGAAVWTSVDGITWSRVADLGNVSMDSVTGGGPGLVAVGTGDGDNVDPLHRAVVWTSVDGITWSRVPDETFIRKGLQQMRSVTATGSGLVAVGASGTGDAAVWVAATEN